MNASIKDQCTSFKGFSLIEVMVALVILSILTSGFMTMMNNQQIAINFLEARLAQIDLKREVLSYLMEPEACTKTFTKRRKDTNNPNDIESLEQYVIPQSGDYDNRKIDGIRDRENRPVIVTGSRHGGNNNILLIDVMNIRTINSSDTFPHSTPPSFARGTVRLRLKIKYLKVGGGNKVVNNDIRLFVTTDSNGVIIHCGLQGGDCAPGKFVKGFEPNGTLKCDTPPTPPTP